MSKNLTPQFCKIFLTQLVAIFAYKAQKTRFNILVWIDQLTGGIFLQCKGAAIRAN